MGSEEEEAVYSPTQGSVFSNSPVNSIEEESNSLNHSPYSPDYVPSPLKRPISPEQDRISALPDAIIHHILSFLPTNDSIKTSVLSKRWVNLWSFVPNLSFRVLDSQPDKLFRIIDGTLNSYSSTQIKKFLLRFNYYLLTDKIPKSNMDSYIDLWLRFATKQNAEELCLKFCSKRVQLGNEKCCDRYKMPKFIFDDFSLTKLRSRCCDYMPKGEVSWTSLKVLSIGNAVLTNNILQRILLGSPILEELELHYCLILTSLNVISSGSLKRLVIEDFYNPQKTVEEFKYSVIEISAPNLKSLGILRRWTGTRCHLLNVSSLIDAHIDFVLYYDCTVSYNEFMESMYEIFQKIKHVEQLTIGAGCIQALSVVEDLGLPSPLLNCICNWKCLILHMRGISRFGLIGMASLLQNSPNVEKLVLDDMTRCESFAKYIPIHPTGENFWTLGERSFSCLLRQLKTIELDAYSWLKFQGLQDEIVEFLLQNAMVLEKMVVCSWHLYMSSYDCYEEARKLLSFPRASPHAVILLPKLLD